MRSAATGFGILYAILQIALSYVVQPNYRPDVSERFIERRTDIPSMIKSTADQGHLNLTNFSAWIANPDNKDQRHAYIAPVILPLDLVYLVALGCFLGSLSRLAARHVGLISSWRPWQLWAFPGAYMVCDLTEDILILLTLSGTLSLTHYAFYLLRAATIAKLVTVTVAIVQTALLAVLWGAARLGLMEYRAA